MRNLFEIGSAINLITWSEERPEELARVLLELLDDQSPVVRRGAARLMGTTAIKTALPNLDQPGEEPLSEILKRLEDGKSKVPPEKSKVAIQFEKLKVENRLRRLRDHDPDESVREAARTSLQRLASVHKGEP